MTVTMWNACKPGPRMFSKPCLYRCTTLPHRRTPAGSRWYSITSAFFRRAAQIPIFARTVERGEGPSVTARNNCSEPGAYVLLWVINGCHFLARGAAQRGRALTRGPLPTDASEGTGQRSNFADSDWPGTSSHGEFLVARAAIASYRSGPTRAVLSMSRRCGEVLWRTQARLSLLTRIGANLDWVHHKAAFKTNALIWRELSERSAACLSKWAWASPTVILGVAARR